MADELKQCEKKIADLQKQLAPHKDWNSGPGPVPLANAAQDGSYTGVDKLQLKARRILNALTGKVSAFDWAPDSHHLASASQDGKLIIWNAFTNNKDHFISLQSAWFMTTSYSPSGKMICVGGLDNKCTVYQLPEEEQGGTEQKIHLQLEKHGGYIGTCKYLSEEEILTGSGDQTAILWDVERKVAKQTFIGHTGDVSHLDTLPGSEDLFVTGSTDKTCKLWDTRIAGNHVVCTFPGHDNCINSVQFFPGGSAFGSGSDDSTCRLWDLKTLRQLNVYADEEHNSNVTSVCFSKSGHLMFAGHDDAYVFVWNVATGALVSELHNHDQHITQVGVSPDGKALCTSSRDTTLSVWA